MKRVMVIALDMPGCKFTFLQAYVLTLAQAGITECAMYGYTGLRYVFGRHIGYVTFTVFIGAPGAVGTCRMAHQHAGIALRVSVAHHSARYTTLLHA